MTYRPPKRYKLKAKIIENGYWHEKDFAIKARINKTQLNRILIGFEYPRPKVQVKIAKTLGITLTELSKLL